MAFRADNLNDQFDNNLRVMKDLFVGGSLQSDTINTTTLNFFEDSTMASQTGSLSYAGVWGDILLNGQSGRDIVIQSSEVGLKTAQIGGNIVWLDSTDLSVNCPFTFTQTTAGNYVFDHDSGGQLSLRNSTSGAQTQFHLFSEDGDGTDGVFFSLTAKGTVADSTTALERLNFRYAAGTTSFLIFTQASGTGTVRPLSIYTGANTTQLVLNIDGTTSIAKGVYNSSDGTAGITQTRSWRDETAALTHTQVFKSGILTSWTAC